MNGTEIFIDSNILLALFDGSDQKKSLARSYLNQNHLISTQVINENVAVCLKKLKLTKKEAFAHGVKLIKSFKVIQISTDTILGAFMISEKYNFSIWDSLILFTALE